MGLCSKEITGARNHVKDDAPYGIIYNKIWK